jgi:hypothetical protein
MKHFLNLLLLLLSVTTHADNIVTVYPKGGEARVVSLEVVNENTNLVTNRLQKDVVKIQLSFDIEAITKRELYASTKVQ